MEKEQKLAATLTCYILMFPAMTSTINNIVLSMFGIQTSFDNIIMYGILFVFFAISLVKLKLVLNIKHFIVIFIFLANLFYTILFYRKSLLFFWTSADDISNPAYVFVFLTISGFFVSLNLKDADIFLKEAEKWSIIVVVLSFLQYIITYINRLNAPQYMVFSYNMLFGVTFLFLLAFREPKVYRWIFALLGFALIFVAGCRGALVSLAVAVFIFLLFFSGFNTKKRTYIFILGLIIVPIVYFQIDTILSFLAKILEALNIESRTIELALEESFSNDSGRGDVQQIILSKLNLFGYGLFGDRRILSGRYAHNLFIEWLCDFGIVFGAIISVSFVLLIVRSLKRTDYKWKLVICALLSSGFIKLMFSGSFLNQEPSFYVLLGLCLNTKLFKNNKDMQSSLIRR